MSTDTKPGWPRESRSPEEMPPDQISSERQMRLALMGIALIVIGLMAIVAVATQSVIIGVLIVPLLGVLFLALGVASGHYGAFIPGSILTGLGAGLLISQELMPGASGTLQGSVTVLGLGLGFVAITPLCWYFRRVRMWWPMIPGGILLIVGACLLIGGPLLNILSFTATYFWPLALVAAGGYLLWRVNHAPIRTHQRRHHLVGRDR